MMSKFVGVFRELSTFTELLHTQIELILVERLHHNWLNPPKVLLPPCIKSKPIACCFVFGFAHKLKLSLLLSHIHRYSWGC